MLYAILRHVKFTSKTQARLATAHNYRTDHVPNADEQAPHPNIEFVNTQQRDYWEIAEERIQEAGIKIRRSDQIRCVEIVLTASPEFFKRDADERALDVQDSRWLKDVRTYLNETYGEKNVVACQLQQDEKSPHVHAVVVPITPDGRLSARDVFNPRTLRDYQTKFAEAMKPHGLMRGVEHSQAKHQPMKMMYGQQGQTAAELGAQLGPTSTYQDVPVKRPGMRNYGNLTEWEATTTAQVNAKARAQVDAANQRAEKAQILALENAAAKEQVRVLQKQLATSEKLKEGYKAESDEIAKRIAGGEAPPAKWVKNGNELLDKAIGQLRDGRQSLRTFESWGDESRIKEQSAKNKAMEADLSRFAGGKTRLADLDAETARGKALHAALLKHQEEKRADDLIIDQQNKRQAAITRVTNHELSLMDRAISHWKINPGDLTACLIVPEEKAEAVQKALTIPGSSYAASILVQGEPHRRDGLKAVYLHYQAGFAPKVDAHFSRIREIGGEVYEHAGSQTRREQLKAQPHQKIQEREQEPTKSKDFGIGG
jgi:hypothetical protein